MTDLSATSLPLSILKPVPSPSSSTSPGAATGTTMSASETAKRAQIAKSGKDFEAAFLNIMLGQMMSGVKATTFGGGEGEEAFKSFMTDAMAKSMVKHGGIGMAKMISADMLKMQGLAPTPAVAATLPAAKASSAKTAPAPTLDAAPTLDIAA